MKKTMAYTATAILVGFAIMMIPLALETGPPTYQPQLQPQFMNTPSPETEDTKFADVPNSRSSGFAAQPLNLLPSSLILLSGLIAALAVYTIFKKRIP